MITKCMIVDDEPLAVQALGTLLNRLDGIEITAACNDVFQAFTVLQKKKIDLLFLDIEMPEMTGLELLKSLQHPPKVILVTAYREHALEAFDLNVLDYLLKPVSFDRLLQALEKFYATRGSALSESQQEPVPEQQFLFIRTDKKTVRVPCHDIWYIESLKDYVKVHTIGGTLLSKNTIKSLESSLPAEQFVRIHRSYIVNLARVHSFSPNLVEIKQRELPIGRIYKARALAALGR